MTWRLGDLGKGRLGGFEEWELEKQGLLSLEHSGKIGKPVARLTKEEIDLKKIGKKEIENEEIETEKDRTRLHFFKIIQ